MPPNINNMQDGFGKPVAELAAVLETLNEDAKQRLTDRVNYHVDKFIHAAGFPSTGFQLLQLVLTICEVAVADLVSEGYLQVTDKGFVSMDVEA